MIIMIKPEKKRCHHGNFALTNHGNETVFICILSSVGFTVSVSVFKPVSSFIFFFVCCSVSVSVSVFLPVSSSLFLFVFSILISFSISLIRLFKFFCLCLQVIN